MRRKVKLSNTANGSRRETSNFTTQLVERYSPPLPFQTSLAAELPELALQRNPGNTSGSPHDRQSAGPTAALREARSVNFRLSPFWPLTNVYFNKWLPKEHTIYGFESLWSGEASRQEWTHVWAEKPRLLHVPCFQSSHLFWLRLQGFTEWEWKNTVTAPHTADVRRACPDCQILTRIEGSCKAWPFS